MMLISFLIIFITYYCYYLFIYFLLCQYYQFSAKFFICMKYASFFITSHACSDAKLDRWILVCDKVSINIVRFHFTSYFTSVPFQQPRSKGTAGRFRVGVARSLIPFPQFILSQTLTAVRNRKIMSLTHDFECNLWSLKNLPVLIYPKLHEQNHVITC